MLNSIYDIIENRIDLSNICFKNLQNGLLGKWDNNETFKYNNMWSGQKKSSEFFVLFSFFLVFSATGGLLINCMGLHCLFSLPYLLRSSHYLPIIIPFTKSGQAGSTSPLTWAACTRCRPPGCAGLWTMAGGTGLHCRHRPACPACYSQGLAGAGKAG